MADVRSDDVRAAAERLARHQRSQPPHSSIRSPYHNRSTAQFDSDLATVLSDVLAPPEPEQLGPAVFERLGMNNGRLVTWNFLVEVFDRNGDWQVYLNNALWRTNPTAAALERLCQALKGGE